VARRVNDDVTGSAFSRGESDERFNLDEDARRARRVDRRTTIPTGIVAVLLGAFALTGAAFSPTGSSEQALVLLIGLLFTSLAVAILYLVLVGNITGMDIRADGLRVYRSHRSPVSIEWGDPYFSLDITAITVPPASLVGPTNPMAIHPQRFLFRHPFSAEITVPRELMERVIAVAAAHGLRASPTPVLLFGVTAPRAPGVSLDSRDIEPGDSTPANGTIVRLRGPSADP
jgi:hypothetical protein